MTKVLKTINEMKQRAAEVREAVRDERDLDVVGGYGLANELEYWAERFRKAHEDERLTQRGE